MSNVKVLCTVTLIVSELERVPSVTVHSNSKTDVFTTEGAVKLSVELFGLVNSTLRPESCFHEYDNLSPSGSFPMQDKVNGVFSSTSRSGPALADGPLFAATTVTLTVSCPQARSKSGSACDLISYLKSL